MVCLFVTEEPAVKSVPIRDLQNVWLAQPLMAGVVKVARHTVHQLVSITHAHWLLDNERRLNFPEIVGSRNKKSDTQRYVGRAVRASDF